MITIRAQTLCDTHTLDDRQCAFDVAELIRAKRFASDGIVISLLGGLVCLDWAASLGLNPTFFTKHCRVPLKRLKTGKSFTQTLVWEEPTDAGVRTIEVRLAIQHVP